MKKLFFLTILTLLFYGKSAQAQKLFMAVGGGPGGGYIIPGETTDTDPIRANQFDVFSFSEGASAPCQLNGTCSPASQSSLNVMIPYNTLSYQSLKKALYLHDVFNVFLYTSVDNTPASPTGSMTVLYGAQIESVQISGASGGNASVSVSITAPKWRYSVYYSKGVSIPGVVYGWDFQTNTAF